MEESLNLFEFVHNNFFTFSNRQSMEFGQIVFCQFETEPGAEFKFDITYQSSFGKIFGTNSGIGTASYAAVGGKFNLGEFDQLPVPGAPKYYGGIISLHATYGSQELDYAWTVIDHSQENGKTSSISSGEENVIYFGNDASNSVRTGSGADFIDGGNGIDVMRGGAGNDVYYVTSGDKVYEKAGEGNDLIVTDSSYTLLDNQSIESLIAYSTSPIELVGNDLGQTIVADTTFADGSLDGRGGHDVLITSGGRDTLDGGSGADRMTGGSGNDTYYVDDAGDKIVEIAGKGTDTVLSSVACTLAANVERLTLQGEGAIAGTGNKLDNLITGNTKANVLDGGLGNDILKGGSGLDTFVFSTALGSTNVDHITDFATAKEKIHLDHEVFSGLSAGALDSTQFAVISGSQKYDGSDHIVYRADKHALYFDADGYGGTAKAIAFAVLDNHPASLSAGDFLIV